MLNKIVIANRGEIACRIIRTAKRLGIRTVAVFSKADKHALHVQLADEAYAIGAAPSTESYLRGDKILAVAEKSQAQAIHPGYGFLAENAEFAESCGKANIIFIGPSAHAMRTMGAKHTAKQCVSDAGVPVLPGYHGDKQDDALLRQAADDIGYPVLLKATAGGGGKGMRIVRTADAFDAALASAKREALSSFANDDMLVEKYLENPRHVELQIFADNHGNVIHLFERDCSLQRRQQKIIEEAPAPKFSEKTRQLMAKAATDAARSVNYVGAGTIEFLYDNDEKFYFMEMNTRLQVEHPVTEMITRIDLVEWQLRIADGETLPTQSVTCKGHAVEARIYAEDPHNDFLPCIGKIQQLRLPNCNEHVRVDSGVQAGDTISPYYDPMIAKLICWGEDRTQAIARLQQALADYRIIGLTTNLSYLQQVINLVDFKQGNIHTNFVHAQHDALIAQEKTLPAAALGAACLHVIEQQALADGDGHNDSPWQCNEAWQLNLPAQQTLCFTVAEETLTVLVDYHGDHLHINWQDQRYKLVANHIAEANIQLTLGKTKHNAEVYTDGDCLHIFYAGQQHSLFYNDPQTRLADEHADGAHLTAPMPGAITAIMVAINDSVKQGDALLTIEAMKMEHTLYAPCDGEITELPFSVGSMVEEGIELVGFEATA